MTLTEIILIYIAVINVLTFALFGLDKLKAKHRWWRVPEKTLMWMAAIGGTPGAILGMKVWHHKTLHKKFKYGVPAILILQLSAIALCIYFFYLRS